MAAKTPFYITTAISYPNGAPHIGHAYEVIATDAIARFMRLDGYDVFFLTGTDEHGQKMQQTAAREGLHRRASWSTATCRASRPWSSGSNCSNDDFIRTTEERHHRSSQAIWRADGGERRHLSRRNMPAGIRCATRPITTRTRRTSNEHERARRHQDRHAGRVGGGGELFLPALGLSGQAARPLRSACRISCCRGSGCNEVASFVQGRPAGPVDLAHHLRLGHAGAGRPQARHVCVGRRADQLHHRASAFPTTDSEKFKRYWPADLHVIGKDIVRFHAVYWPAFLMSAGIEVPRRIFSHGFLFNRGEKMSKSVGNVVDPFALADAYGVDQLRYFFLREVPFGQDGNYSHEAIVNRINADLANDLGNLAQRSLSMIGKQLGGVLPKPGAFSDADKAILAAADAMIGKAREHMKTQQLHQVLNTVWAVVADANRYFAGEAPWALAKTDPARQGTVLYVTAEVIRQVAHPGAAVHAGVGRRSCSICSACRPDEREFAGSAARQRHRAGHDAAGARAGVPALCRAGSRRKA